MPAISDDCEHLLKIKYWQQDQDNCFRGWKSEVINFRLQIEAILKDSPNLKNYLTEIFVSEYQNGRKLFLNASGLDATIVPREPKFTLGEARDEDWLPWRP